MSTLFALGSNGSGQLGIGHKADVSVPKQVLLPSDCNPVITAIAAGGNHTLLLSSAGDLFWAGDHTSGACGRVPDALKSVVPQFHRVRLSDSGEDFKVGMVAATWEATIVTRLDAQGRNTAVYSFGVGMKGELGLGDMIIRTPSPSWIADFPPEGTEVVDLAACMGHVVAVLSNGDVYGWGNGRKGQLGTPEAVITSPRKFAHDRLDFKVGKAVCGKDFTLLVGAGDTPCLLFLGLDKWRMKLDLPLTAWGCKDVRAGWSNVYVLKDNGHLMSWSRDDHGQKAPLGLPDIEKIAVGSEHVLALSEDGNVLTWGWGEHGNCGPTKDKGDVKGRWNVIANSQYLPPGCKVTNIGAGCATSWIVMRDSS